MLKPIKTFYSEINPTYSVFEEAKQIAVEEDCVVEVRWYPSCYTGWYHEYVFADSDVVELADKVPKVYGW
jgi:hypothetical protein